MKRIESRGLVLYNRNYRERDKLVKIFTEKAGKRMFFVRQPAQAKLASVIQPLTTASFILKLSDSGLGFIEDYRESQAFPKINGHIFKLANASYLIALADAAIQDGEADMALFAFLLKTLELMEEGLDEDILINIFEIQVLGRFGVQLNFHECAICHRVGLAFDFSYNYSGLLCPDHYDKDSQRSQLDPNVPYLLDRLQSLKFDDLQAISIKPEMKAKLRQFIDQLYEEYVGVHLKAKKFLDDLGEWGQIFKED